MFSPSAVHLSAAILPMLVLGAASWELGRPEPWAPDAWVAELDARMAREPDVVIVGNSIAQSAIDVTALEATLGRRVVVLTENASPGATWYTLLRFRVWNAGYRPSLVLVLGPLTHLLNPTPASAEGLAHLQRHFAEPDETIAQKTLGSSGPVWWGRMKERRSHTREAWTAALRDLVGGPGSAEVLARVFDSDALVGELGARVIPVAEEQEAVLPGAQTGVEASYIPDLMEKAAENGARIVFVRPPMNPSAPAEDRVSAVLEAETISRINAGASGDGSGAGWLDMRDLGFGSAQFRDSRHMSASGRTRFTAALAEALQDIGALGEGQLRPAEIPLVLAKVTRTGEPPPLPLTPEPSSDPCSISSMSKLGFLSNGALGRAGIEAPTPLQVRGADPADTLTWTPRRAEVQDCSGKWTFVGPRLLVSPRSAGAPWSLIVRPDLPLRHGDQDVWWLYPGTQLDFRLDRAPSGPWSVRVTLDGVGAAAEEGMAPVMELRPLDGTTQRGVLVADADSPTGKAIRWAGELSHEGAGPWSLVVESPAGGPWSVIRKLEVRHGDEAQVVTELRSKNLPIVAADYTCTAPPPLTINGPIVPMGGHWLLPVAEASGPIDGEPAAPLQLAPAQIISLAGSLVDSPVRLTIDGAAVAHGPVQPAGLSRGPGYTWTNRGVQLRTEDPDDPSANPGRYSVVLAEERSGPRGRWVYPGDRCEARVRTTGVVRSVLVAGEVAAAPESGATLRLRVQQLEPGRRAGAQKPAVENSASRLLLDQEIPWDEAARGLTLPLLQPGSGELSVELIADAKLPTAFLKTLTLSVDDVSP